MAYSYGISPSIPAIPTLYAHLNEDGKPETEPLGLIVCRDEVPSDMDELARMLSKVFRDNPVDLVRYLPRLISDEKHTRMYVSDMHRRILRRNQRMIVAIDTNNKRIQGYLTYRREGMGDPKDPADSARSVMGAYRS